MNWIPEDSVRNMHSIKTKDVIVGLIGGLVFLVANILLDYRLMHFPSTREGLIFLVIYAVVTALLGAGLGILIAWRDGQRLQGAVTMAVAFLFGLTTQRTGLLNIAFVVLLDVGVVMIAYLAVSRLFRSRYSLPMKIGFTLIALVAAGVLFAAIGLYLTRLQMSSFMHGG